MRGEGRLFQRGSMWWIAYSRNGHEYRETANTNDERKARKYLQQRLADIKKPEFVGPSEKRLDMDDLERKIEADYTRHGRRSIGTVRHCLNNQRVFPVRPVGGHHSVQCRGTSGSPLERG